MAEISRVKIPHILYVEVFSTLELWNRLDCSDRDIFDEARACLPVCIDRLWQVSLVNPGISNCLRADFPLIIRYFVWVGIWIC